MSASKKLKLQDPDVRVKSDMSRFLWNSLAAATSSGPAKLASGELLAQHNKTCIHKPYTDILRPQILILV